MDPRIIDGVRQRFTLQIVIIDDGHDVLASALSQDEHFPPPRKQYFGMGEAALGAFTSTSCGMAARRRIARTRCRTRRRRFAMEKPARGWRSVPIVAPA